MDRPSPNHSGAKERRCWNGRREEPRYAEDLGDEGRLTNSQDRQDRSTRCRTGLRGVRSVPSVGEMDS